MCDNSGDHALALETSSARTICTELQETRYSHYAGLEHCSDVRSCIQLQPDFSSCYSILDNIDP